MANPSDSSVQNLLPVQAYFDVDGNFQTFIGQGQPFYATPDPQQSGLHITDSTIDSTPIGATTPSTGAFTSGTVLAAPTAATDIANKQYVDYYAAGLSWKEPCLVASTANIPTLSGLLTVDTVTLAAGDRVLVKNQSTASQNGIYTAAAGAWSRAVGADDWNEYLGAITFIIEGSQGGSAWYCTAQPGGTLGTTAINWSNFSVSSSYTAGTGLTLAGTQFSITNTGVTAATYGSSSKAVILAVNAQGQITSASDGDISIAGSQITSGTIGASYLSGNYSGITGVGTLGGLTVTNPIVGSITGNAATASAATNLAGGGANYLPYQTAASTTSFVAPGSNGDILTIVAGVPAWAAAPATGVTSFSADSTGLTPATSTTGAVTLGGTLNVASGGTGSGTAGGARTNLGAAASGANSDITSMSGLTGAISSPTYIQYGSGSGTTLAAGRMWYDQTTGSMNVGMGGGNITQQIGEEIFIYGKASAAITEGQLIMKTGVVGASGVITFAPTTAGLTDDQAIIGVATENIALNAFGRITAFGVVHGIDTSAFTDGAILWYDPSSSTGGMTATKPTAPNVKCEIGIVINAGSGGSGSMQVEIIHGTSLGGTDSNVNITSATGGNLLSYDQTAGYWKNINLTAGSNVTITPATNGAITIAAAGGLTVTDDTSTNATRYLTFTSATSGTISTINTSSTKLQYNPSTGAFTIPGIFNATSGIIDASANTGAITLPTGTAAQRPSSPVNGMMRQNSDIGAMEVYDNGSWQQITVTTYTLNVLMIAGGGAGGNAQGGSTNQAYAGGGAGGILVQTTSGVAGGTSLSVSIGSGGASNGSSGSNTTVTGYTTAIGGGGGGFYGGGGQSGGSGGGGANGGGGSVGGGAGTSGQGNNGGPGVLGGGDVRLAGGGGGAASAGASQSAGSATSSYSSIASATATGSSGAYAGGGGGGTNGSNFGGGGGGATGGNGGNASANTGSGSGGAQSGSNNGGSGLVIFYYTSISQRGTGGTVTSSGTGPATVWYHTFTTSGTFIT